MHNTFEKKKKVQLKERGEKCLFIMRRKTGSPRGSVKKKKSQKISQRDKKKSLQSLKSFGRSERREQEEEEEEGTKKERE